MLEILWLDLQLNRNNYDNAFNTAGLEEVR